MKYTIQNIIHHSSDFDDDYLDFKYDIHFTEPEEIYINHYYYSLNRLLPYLEEKHPAFYKYYTDTRSSLDIWGRGERRTIEAMGEEAMHQIYGYLEEYLLCCDWMEGLFYHQKKMQSESPQEQQKNHEEVSVAFKDLSEDVLDIKKIQSQYIRFCETVEKKIRQTALDVYPEIADLEPEQLKKMQHLFVGDIQSMQKKIAALLWEQNE